MASSVPGTSISHASTQRNARLMSRTKHFGRSLAPAAFILFTVTAFTSAASADPRETEEQAYDVEQHRLAKLVRRQGHRPEGAIPLLKLARNDVHATPGLTLKILEGLRNDRALSPPRQALASALRAKLLIRAGKLVEASATIEELGYITRWRIVGPFDNEGKSGFEREEPPEAGRRAELLKEAVFPGKARPVAFRAYPQVSPLGYVNLDAVYRPNNNACAIAENVVESPRDQELNLWVGAGGAVKVYWNGDEVLSDALYRMPHPDRHVIRIKAKQGDNRLLVKSCVADRSWGFFLRLVDLLGRKPDILVRTAEFPKLAPPVEQARMPKQGRGRISSDLDVLTQAAKQPEASAKHLARFAEYMRLTGADDPVEELAKQAAEKAAKKSPKLEHLVLAAQTVHAACGGAALRTKSAAPRSERARDGATSCPGGDVRRFARACAPHAEEARAGCLARIEANGTVGQEERRQQT